MIIAQQTSAPIETNSTVTPSKFKIKASARAFKILSGFYSDPILAIPRELGANAWDSHVSAENTDKMFEVHAPNLLEPWFSIRDFGIGLSAEAIDSIYTTYFESTKTTDNDSDGCMGLGSKTPFNYTENFTVTSWFNGMKHVYNCFIDESGAPNIMKLATEMTTEHNGVEVKFGVKPSDISVFVEKIKLAYAPFRYRPIIKGASIVYPVVNTLYKGKNWALRDSVNQYSHESKAFMGNYSYPITYNALFSGMDVYSGQNKKDYDKVTSILKNGSIDLFFNIGDLEVAPNKEQLQYDANQRTQKAIIAAAVIAFDELDKQVSASIEIPKTLWEAMYLTWKYNNYNSPFKVVRSILNNINIVYNGNKVSTADIRSYDINSKLGLIATGTNYYSHESSMKDGSKFSVKSLRYNPGNNHIKFGSSNCYIANVMDPVIFYTNSDNIKKSRIRHYLQTKFGPSGVIPETVFIFDSSAGFSTTKAHQTYLGLPDSSFLNVEFLPRCPRTPRATQAATTNEIYYTTQGMNSNRSDIIYWSRKPENFVSTETYYYTDFLWSDPSFEGKPVTSAINPIISIAYHKGLINKDVTIYGINKKNIHLRKVGTWVNIIELVKKYVVKNKKEFEQKMYLSDVNFKLLPFSDIRNRLVSRSDFLSKLENKKTQKTFENFFELFKLTLKDENTTKLCAFFDIKSVKHVNLPIDIDDVSKLFKETYMDIFSIVDFYSLNRSTDYEKLSTIINFIDKNS